MRVVPSLVPLRTQRCTWAARLAAVLLLGAWACSGDGEPAAEPAAQAQRISAKIAIAVDDRAAPAPRPERSLFGAPGLVLASDYTYNDIARLRLEVLETATNHPLYVNVDLTRVDGAWTGTLPFLPANTPLTFVAHAFRGSGANAEEIFAGQTQQALSADDQTITITLGSVDSGSFTSLPTIEKITVPKVLASGKSADVNFQVRGNVGEHLSYTITRESPAAGEFFVTNGALTLNSDVGTFVSLYTAPTVPQSTLFSHTVAVTNEAGNTISTVFKTNVLSPADANGVDNTELIALFNPVINALDASRLPGTGNVFWGARVSDDKPLDQLTYAWSFAPGGAFSPAPGFVDAAGSPTPTGNTGTLANYTPGVSGELTLAVTDGDGGTTTVKLGLEPNKFPDNPVQDGGLTGLKSLRAGGYHTCALFHEGKVRCFGYAPHGQLGYGNQNNIGVSASTLPYTAGDVPLGGKAAQISTGHHHTCAVLDNGQVRCWGLNDYGQLGYNSTQSVGDNEPITAFGYVNLGGVATKVEAGFEHTCALMATGKVRCWGRNDHGQLGYGINTGSHANVGDDEAPFTAGDVDLGAGVAAKDVVVGRYHTCALLTDGNVKCWGHNANHELGYGDVMQIGDDETPASVGTLNVGGPVVQISAGLHHTCALLAAGNVRCWGYGYYGQLGYGSTSSVSTAASAGDVNLGGAASQISAGAHHTCALLTNGELKCWGYNYHGQLGYNGTTDRSSPGAALALGGSTALQVATGHYQTCALLTNGQARCWGYGAYGQLGYGNTNTLLVPTAGGNVSIATP